ncbi:hypothetical protein [Flavivirga jejuensis]|uniref:Peptide-N(4)-(N-acetyl-beta-glucosaminyl)asparagine amidase n=1 Tax=Flavivirga jejuensis TaxID=870487 RepID=A0ABT8WSU5_9FLAO|nr:hypothetical protein [Flavivirga jejuensis]MDO5975927.1 hypothetical protein [Flavivirga jejuensis]
MMKYINNCFFIFCLTSIVSCSDIPKSLELALKEAGDNRHELEKVLNFYKENPRDSLKYKAALFLIENMPNHFSYKPIKGFEGAFDSINNHPNSRFRKDVFEKLLDSMTHTTPKRTELVSDIKVLTSNFIINNVELSFEAWNKIPKNKRASFDDFCNYILPYKNNDEPIEENSREKLFRKYAWVYSYLDKGTSLISVVDSITSEFGHENMTQIRKYYPIPLSISQIEKSRIGLCDDGVNYFVHVFRALGIICTKDMISHWGNHHSSGHSWIYVRYGDDEYATQVFAKRNVKIEYIGESIPKVNRLTFASQKKFNVLSFLLDVTGTYVPTIDIDVENKLNAPFSNPVICVFDISREWIPIGFGEINKKKLIHYDDLGVNVLYIAATLQNNEIIPFNYPFYINKNKQIHYFEPTIFKQDSIILTRKYGLTTPRHRNKLKWITSLNGGFFEGANTSDFNNSNIIYELSHFNSTHLQTIELNELQKFKYVRFNSNGKESYFAKLAFFDEKRELLIGKVIKQNNFEYSWGDGAFDNDPLSFSGGENFTLGLKFNEPKPIKFIDFQVRNDGNHINMGDEYELFYWNKNWKSLGTQVAKDTVLYYNAPENSLLWLRNLTKGKEEHVFYIDKNKKQRWLGFDNYL